MVIYIINFLVLIFTGVFYSLKYINKKTFIIIFLLIQILIVGFRSPYIGLTDTWYVYLPNYHDIYWGGLMAALSQGKDILFQISTLLFSKIFGVNDVLYLVVFSIPYIVGVSFFIYKYSRNILFSFIVFSSLQFFTIQFALMRQVTAMGILFFAFDRYMEKKYKSAILLVIIASFFHQISIVFFLVPIIIRVLRHRKLISLVLPLLGLVISKVFSGIIDKVVMYIISGNTRYGHMVDNTQTTNLTSFIVFYLLFVLVWFVSYNDKSKIMLNIIPLISVGVLLTSWTTLYREMGRVAYLFLVFLIIGIPNSSENFSNKINKFLFSSIICIGVMFYFLFFLGQSTNTIPYIPNWK